MPYGIIYSDTVQGSTANTAPVFKDGNTVEIGQLCKVWLKVGGDTGIVGTISGSFNVSSVTVNGTGDQTANFATSVSSSGFSGLTTGNFFNSTGVASSGVAYTQTSYYQAGSFRYGHQQSNAYATFTYMSIAIFR